jgi:hypothetical protein
MQSASLSRKFAGALAALALCTSSTGAIAASTQQVAHQMAASPMVTLSLLASDASRAAVCGASAAAAAGAAAAAQGAAQGCVLPVSDVTAGTPVAVDTMPPPPVPPPPVEPVGGGFAFSPLLLALAGIAAAVLAVTLLGKDDDDDDESPD